MQERQILINAFMSIVQIIIIGAVLFILYKFLLNAIGVKQLGIWALVLATTSVTQIANFGLSGSVVKFVAKYIAKEDEKSVSDVIQTAVLSVGIIVAIILIIFFPIIKCVLRLVLPEGSFPMALSILPFAIFAFWIMTVTSIFESGLDGYQRIDIRSMLLMGGAIFHLVLCFLLVPFHGLLGLAYAKVMQNISVLCVSWIMLNKYIKGLPIVPFKWNKKLFKEMLGYGVNFEIISITRMLYAPVTKTLLSKFGGLSMVGYYEMASRMVQQFRALIVSANQVLVPAIADLKERTPQKIKSVYSSSYELLFYFALPLYSLIILCTPIISVVWIGHYESVFVVFATLLAIGRFLNTLSAPAYFAYLGIGELRWNVIAHITIGLLNAGLGLLLGLLYDGIGVIVAWVFSLALGSSIIYFSYHIRNGIPLTQLLPEASRVIMAACLIGIFSAFMVQCKLNHVFSSIAVTGMTVFSFSIIVFVPFWFHPLRKRLMGWVTNELLNRKARA